MINEIVPMFFVFCIDIIFIYMLYDSKDTISNEMFNDKSMDGRIGIILMIFSILIVLTANVVMIYNILII
jgi:hypothetical protein